VGSEDAYVFAITERKRLWRSVDGGSTFTDATPALAAAIQQAEDVAVLQLIQDRENPQNVLIVGAGTYMWVTNDFGATFRGRQNPGRWSGAAAGIRAHPFVSSWMLALVRRPNCKARVAAPARCRCRRPPSLPLALPSCSALLSQAQPLPPSSLSVWRPYNPSPHTGVRGVRHAVPT